MSVEYEAVRLAGLASRFPAVTTLNRIIEGIDGRSLAMILCESVFHEEMESLLARSGNDISANMILRSIGEGQLRLRLMVTKYVRSAFPDDYNYFLARWELEEIKSCLRYFSSGGASAEKRFRFTSYIMAGAGVTLWRRHMSFGDFILSLEKAKHPLAAIFESGFTGVEGADDEHYMELSYFGKTVPPMIELYPETAFYFRDEVDFINIKNGLLLREDPNFAREAERYHLDHGGAITLSDFKRIGAESIEKMVGLIENRTGVSLTGLKVDFSLSSLCIRLRRAFLRRLKLANIKAPMGPIFFLYAIESLDAMLSDLRTAIYYGGSGAPADSTNALFTSHAYQL